MYITRGIVVDAGASLTQDPLYDDKIKVRIPDLHGYGDLVTSFQEKSFTKDEDLPWCKILATGTDYYSYYPVLQYKAQNYAPADIVYVQVEENISNPLYLVVGLYAKYNEDAEGNDALNVYNGIDVSNILANKTEFPAELLVITGSGSGGSLDDDSSVNSDDSEEGLNINTGPSVGGKISSFDPKDYFICRQNSSTYGGIPFGGSYISSSGCGCCSSYMVIRNTTTYTPTLEQLSKQFSQGHAIASGTNMVAAAKVLKSKYHMNYVFTSSRTELRKHLKQGYMAVAHVGGHKESSLFSKHGGHFVCVGGIIEGKTMDQDRAIVLDPSFRVSKYDPKQRAVWKGRGVKWSPGKGDKYDALVSCRFIDLTYDGRKTQAGENGYFCLLTPTKNIQYRGDNPPKDTSDKDKSKNKG